MAIKVLKGHKIISGREDIWVEEIRIKNLTPAKRNLIKKLTKNRPLEEQ